MRHGIDKYWGAMRRAIIPLFDCTIDLIRGIDKDKVPEETLQVAYLVTKIYGWNEESTRILNDTEIKLFLRILEGCKLCSQYQNCPYTNITAGKQTVRNTFCPSEKTQIENDRMLSYLRKLIKEN